MNNEKLPVNIELAELELSVNGTMFVKLKTLSELEDFWEKNKELFKYAVEGVDLNCDQTFLNGYEWVFGKTKESVVRTFMRWDETSVKCDFYDQSKENYKEHKSFFLERDNYREDMMKRDTWTIEDEEEYQVDCLKKTPDSYRGWWRLTNLPNGLNSEEWVDPYAEDEELYDINMSTHEVAQKLQVQIFNSWMESDWGELRFYDRKSIEEKIFYWRNEKNAGQDYYGSENEV
ncbi:MULTISPECIES: hypothetical protein [Halomonas]|uniref:hypothetical protein n=1 Tax=Halomonas TaxID=2745 RepID=UPI001143BBCE|nr:MULTISPECIES: hypothetical protein [Halomonas]